ncbi:MAG: acyl-CoA reductase [Eubacterium sp.]|nr:acyl-CoA reductase [Eubacterium sp.]
MNRNTVEYLFGSENIRVVSKAPFTRETCEFLDALSKALRKDERARLYPDIQTFAFWIRKANIQSIKKKEFGLDCRMGKGLIFHVAPSNVPVNFAYSLVFGMLAGNSNIIKISSKKHIQSRIICSIMDFLSEKSEFSWVKEQNAVVAYGRGQSEKTDAFSAACDMRIIWGGDPAIAQIRKSLLQPRSTEITFADRYSIALMGVDAIVNASDQEMLVLAQNFYNDTYLMDQNACSSPHMVVWTGEREYKEQAEIRFWDAVYGYAASRYDLADMKVSEKYTLLCELAVMFPILKLHRYENILYIVEIEHLVENVAQLRGKFGLFFTCFVDGIDHFVRYMDDKKVQTCTIYGIDAKRILDCMLRSHIRGIDRIVPIGKAMDIGVVWDGYDLMNTLSRRIEC